jgi:SAM-dependent methyltransferase
MDVAAYKEAQKARWRGFESVARFTAVAASSLVRFAGVSPGLRVLDVGTGTGNVAITAAREGAVVAGVDITPELLAIAKNWADMAGVPQVTWREGDVESLPFDDGAFDVVLSQFAHIFAPNPEKATSEMLRVLKPGGRIAFATWPPESFPGRRFDFQARVVAPPPSVPAVTDWGIPKVIRARLGSRVTGLEFERGSFSIPTLGPRFFYQIQEDRGGPLQTFLQEMAKRPNAADLRAEFEDLLPPFLQGNEVRHDFLLTRAIKT